MATFSDEDKKNLQTLWKAFQGVAASRTDLTPWQEALERDASVYAAKSVLASQIIHGFAGSWAGSYSADFGGSIQPPGSTPEPYEGVDPVTSDPRTQWHRSRLGQRGAPELNFPPFNTYTNASGPKGGGLVGHPISFEVVGPTLKSQYCDWTWEITQGGGGFGGDLFEMSLTPSGSPASSSTILEGYNIANFTMGGLTEPNGGLYLVITEDGRASGAISGAFTPLVPLARYEDTATTEVFRIVAARVNQFEIHPNKPLSRYFDLPAASIRYIRAIMVIAPFATRLAAIPTGRPGQTTTGKGGREQVFAVVLPERAAAPDLYPPYNGPGVGTGSWLLGGFTEDAAPGTSTAVGEPALYGGKVALPIPTPRGVASGNVERGAGLLPSVNAGLWRIEMADTTGFVAGSTIVKVFQTNRDSNIQSPTYGRMGSCLGYFTVYSVIPATAVVLGRVAEIFIENLKIYFGPGPYIQSVLLTPNITLSMVLYEPVSELWQGALNLDKIQTSRLRPLIDPKWVAPISKQLSNSIAFPPVPGSGPGRPDKAIFGTEEGAGAPLAQVADPGNLNDLGFRMVLFPARTNISGDAIPDFRKPIDTREIIIDPAITEPQYVDIDYAAGIVTLSHPPPNLADITIGTGEIIPNGIWGLSTNNPRAEVVLFATCVPYSMEEGQAGTGIRVRTRSSEEMPIQDLYSSPIHANIDTTVTTWNVGVAPYVGVSPLTALPDIILNQLWEGPQTGVFEILSGSLGSPSYGMWAYNNLGTVTSPQGGLVTFLRGISCLTSASDPSFISSGDIRTIVLRRDAIFALQSLAPSTSLPGGRWYTDTFGGTKRSQEIVMDGVDVSISPTGVPTFKVRPQQFMDRAWGQIIPSKMPVGVGNPTNGTPYGNYFAEEGILAGLAYQVPLGHPNGPEPGGLFSVSPSGPSIALEANQAAPTWHGIISRYDGTNPSGVMGAGDDWRYIAKFSIEYDLNIQFANFFLGFVQFEGIPPSAITADLISQGPAGVPIDYSVFGVWHEGLVDPSLNIWSRASGVPDVITTLGNVTVDAVSGLVYGPYTIVMDCVRVPESTFISTMSLRTTLYDDQGAILATTQHANTSSCPGDGPGLVFCQVARLTGGGPTVRLHLYGSSILTYKNKPMIGP